MNFWTNFDDLSLIAGLQLQEFYLWCEAHPLFTGAMLGIALLGSLNYLTSWRMRKKKRLHRLLWGAKMRRSRNRLAFERSSIAMAIEDCLFEMEYAGDTTKKSADEWRHAFANHFQMDELLPRRDQGTVKRSIRNRINKGIHQVKSIIPGGLPAVKVDSAYVPKVVLESETKMRSKFA